jgi:hypothetical protein
MKGELDPRLRARSIDVPRSRVAMRDAAIAFTTNVPALLLRPPPSAKLLCCGPPSGSGRDKKPTRLTQTGPWPDQITSLPILTRRSAAKC